MENEIDITRVKVLEMNIELIVGMFLVGNIVEFAIHKGLPTDAKCISVKWESGIISFLIYSATYPQSIDPVLIPTIPPLIAFSTNFFKTLCKIADADAGDGTGILKLMTAGEMQKLAQECVTKTLTATGRIHGSESQKN